MTLAAALLAACDSEDTIDGTGQGGAGGSGAEGGQGGGGQGGGGGGGGSGGSGGGVEGFLKSAGGLGDETGSRVVVAPGGDLVVSGGFDASIDLGGGALMATNRDGFVARFDQGGELLWTRQLASAGVVGPISLALDSAGDVLCAANFTLAVELGGDPLTSDGGSDVVVAKLDGESGDVLLQVAFGGASDAFAASVAAGADDAVIVAGIFQGTLEPGFGAPLTADGGVDVFLVALEADGTGAWSKRLGGPGAVETASAAGVAGDGSVIVTGHFGGAADFGGGTVASSGTRDIFVARYDAMGSALLDFASFPWEGTSYLEGFDTRVASDGSVLLTGQFGSSVTFGAIALNGTRDDQNDVFVARLDPELLPLFASAHGGQGENHIRGAALGPNGDILLGSVAIGAADFGGPQLPNAAALALLDGDGEHLASRRLGGFMAISPEGVAEAEDGAWLVTGYITQAVDLGAAGMLSHAGGTDFFLARIYPDAP
jgi:hypothetical protein